MCLSSMSSAPGERRSSADAHWYEVDSSTPCEFDVEAQGYISRVFLVFFLGSMRLLRSVDLRVYGKVHLLRSL